MKTKHTVLVWQKTGTGMQIRYEAEGYCIDKMTAKKFSLVKLENGMNRVVCQGTLAVCKAFAQDQVDDKFYFAASVEQMGDDEVSPLCYTSYPHSFNDSPEAICIKCGVEKVKVLEARLDEARHVIDMQMQGA